MSLDVRLAAKNSTKTKVDYPWIDGVIAKVKAKTGVDIFEGNKALTTFDDIKGYYN